MRLTLKAASLSFAAVLAIAGSGLAHTSSASAAPMSAGKSAPLTDGGLQINSAVEAEAIFDYRVNISTGAILEQNAATEGVPSRLTVKDANGSEIGEYIPAWVSDSGGNVVASTTTITNSSILTQISPSNNTKYPITVAAPTYASETDGEQSLLASMVSVPSNYVYDENKKPKWAHDYCTKSPDEYHTPGKNASFRGPCARHDMCYQRGIADGNFKSVKSDCDRILKNHLVKNCDATYGGGDPRRYTCRTVAHEYWAGVIVFGG